MGACLFINLSSLSSPLSWIIVWSKQPAFLSACFWKVEGNGVQCNQCNQFFFFLIITTELLAFAVKKANFPLSYSHHFLTSRGLDKLEHFAMIAVIWEGFVWKQHCPKDLLSFLSIVFAFSTSTSLPVMSRRSDTREKRDELERNHW